MTPTERWQHRRWGDLAVLEYGRALRGYRQDRGQVRVFGTNGPIGWTTEAHGPGPTVVVGRKGAYRGVHYTDGPFWVIDTAYWLRAIEPLDMHWAYYNLLTHDINGRDSGSAIPSFSRPDFGALGTLVPPLEEQHAIAAVLGALDNKIEANRRKVVVLSELTGATWQDQFGPDASRKWPLAPIGDLASVVGGSTPSTAIPEFWNGDIAWATPRDLSRLPSVPLLETERRITEQGLQKISSGLLPVGALLLSSRAPIGYLAIAEVPLTINQGFIALVAADRVSNLYLWQWLLAHLDDVRSRANGTTFLEVSKANFRPMLVEVPPRQQMQSWTEAAASLYGLIVVTERETASLAQMRDTLLPKLLSGELRVRDASTLVEEAV